MKWKRIARIAGITFGAVVVVGLLVPDSPRIPVEGATPADWNHDTFWYHPWGRSGVHKGIDIFADEGQEVVAPVPGVVVYSGTWGDGGNVVAVLGAKWRIHYHAHMSERHVKRGSFVSAGETIGRVGATGNAAGKPPHLHYSIVTLLPYPWRVRFVPQGWKRVMFLNPHRQLTD